ncbi:PREDICTED: proton-coupled amino acid transporter-like protein CG1139 [Eufriesea mexicana]|uniref:proton-coupled amino acid transporter-like protein CG1139 n=1 Tax=Eufriesea mexicana TaxID=516756 RepID=UPI00083C8886|nr:PREDICTED: proton-coupled amino acid transporter-like protein CG1139 [Eufriesea mexicana]
MSEQRVPPNEDEPYDPYAQQVTTKPVSDFKSLANLVKSAVGTGLFAMPNAFASVGLVIGVIGTILMGVLITGSLHILVKIHHKMCIHLRKPILHYDEVVVASLTTSVQKSWMSTRVVTCIIHAAIIICYTGIGAIYVVFISGIIQEFFDFEETIDQGYYALILFPLFLAMNMIKHLYDIAVMSIIGNLLLFISALLGIIHALKDGIGDKWHVIGPDVSLYPKFVGTVFFSMSSPGLILALQHNMEKPWNFTKFTGVLNHGMAHITLLHTFVGVIGYLKWGTDSVGNFIRNQPVNDVPKITALTMQGLSIYFTYGLQCYMPIVILLEEYIIPALNERSYIGTSFCWNMCIRFGITLMTCLLAAIIPKLDLFIAVVGAVCTSTLSTIIPITLYILVYRNNYGTLKWKLILGLSLLTVASIITLCAIVVNLVLIIEFFRNSIERITDLMKTQEKLQIAIYLQRKISSSAKG